MAKKPLVTVVTATRNRRNLLERLIKSVRAQTYPRVEHVVVDGASDDGTQDLLAQYESQYALRWISEKDRHQVEALNKGLRMARGEFVTVTHDDDYWLPQGIEILIKGAIADPSIDLIYGDSWGEYEGGRRIRRRYAHYSLGDMVNRGYQIPQDGCLLRRSWLERVGYLDEAIEYVPEYELFLRILRAGGRHHYVPHVTSVGGLHEKKKSWLGAKQSWDETWRVNRRHGGKLFSPFTLLYLKNRHFPTLARVMKTVLPGFFSSLRRKARLPDYS